jgi:hypothetical protein
MIMIDIKINQTKQINKQINTINKNKIKKKNKKKKKKKVRRGIHESKSLLNTSYNQKTPGRHFAIVFFVSLE